MANVKAAMEYAAKIEREAIKNGTSLGAAFDAAYADYNFDRRCEMSIWDVDKPLEAMMLSHDHIAILAVKHEKEIQELKRLVTPMMEFKRREWVGLTDEEIKVIVGRGDPGGIGLYTREMFKKIEDKLKEKNGG